MCGHMAMCLQAAASWAFVHAYAEVFKCFTLPSKAGCWACAGLGRMHDLSAAALLSYSSLPMDATAAVQPAIHAAACCVLWEINISSSSDDEGSEAGFLQPDCKPALLTDRALINSWFTKAQR